MWCSSGTPLRSGLRVGLADQDVAVPVAEPELDQDRRSDDALASVPQGIADGLTADGVPMSTPDESWPLGAARVRGWHQGVSLPAASTSQRPGITNGRPTASVGCCSDRVPLRSRACLSGWQGQRGNNEGHGHRAPECQRGRPAAPWLPDSVGRQDRGDPCREHDNDGHPEDRHALSLGRALP